MNENICTNDETDLVPFHVLFDTKLHKEIKKGARQHKMKFSTFINMALREAIFFLDKVSFKFSDLPCGTFGEGLLEIKTKRRLLIDRDLKYKLFHFQNYFKLRSKGAVLRFVMRMYLRKLKTLGEEKLRVFIFKKYTHWMQQVKSVKVWKRWANPETQKNYHKQNIDRIEYVNSFSYVTKVRIL